MAQDGDTITYTYDGDSDANSNLIPEEEDVSAVDEMTIEYANGSSAVLVGGSRGGGVEGTVVDVSDKNTIYIWVAGQPLGRYDGGINGGNGSTEVSFVNTDSTDSSDEPFVVGAGGGAGNAGQIPAPFAEPFAGGGGGRGGQGGEDTSGGGNDGGDGEGIAPPLGGDGGDYDGETFGDATHGDGAVADTPEIIKTGTTTKGGGAPQGNTGEVRITYKSNLSPPDPPSNLSAEVQ